MNGSTPNLGGNPMVPGNLMAGNPLNPLGQ